jgi:glyoxylase-like metal-dependent hydrolase (beta-lactamase superfamily II)
MADDVVRPVEGAWVLALDTPTLPPATATNTLVIGGDRLMIIEPATPHAREQARLDALLAELQAEGRTLAGVIVTHHHVDHIGYATALRRTHGIPILAHPETATRLDFEIDEPIDEAWSVDLGDGHVLEALHTPGHAPGHLLLWDRKTELAHAGDLVAGEGTILVDVRDAGDMGVYLDSLRRMATRVRERVAIGRSPIFVPAHGPILHDPAALLDHYVAHRLAREDKVRRAVLEQGRHSFVRILASAYADTPKRLWPIAALSVEAHLRKLVTDGELVRAGRGARPA